MNPNPDTRPARPEVQGEDPMAPGFVPAIEKLEQAAAEAYFRQLEEDGADRA